MEAHFIGGAQPAAGLNLRTGGFTGTNNGAVPLTIDRRLVGDTSVAVLLGRITLGEPSRALRRCFGEMAAEGHKSVLLDLDGVSFVDSSGLGALVAGYNSMKSAGASLALVRVPGRVRELLELSRLTGVLRIYDSEAEALRGV